MKKETKFVVLLSSGLLWVGIIQAQQSVNATGSVATGSEGTVSYSIGQLVYTTNSANTGTMAQGVQQPYEIFTSDSREVDSGISIALFPNPTTDRLILDIVEYNSEKLSCFLHDYSGRVLFEKQIVEKQTQIEMGLLPAEIYFIKILNKEYKTVQSFKIIKH
jgi:hypothetical protein